MKDTNSLNRDKKIIKHLEDLFHMAIGVIVGLLLHKFL